MDARQLRAAFEALQREQTSANLKNFFALAAAALEEHAVLVITLEDDREVLTLGEHIYNYFNDLGRPVLAAVINGLCTTVGGPRLERVTEGLVQRLAYTDKAETEQHRIAAAWGLVEWIAENVAFVADALLSHPNLQAYAVRAFATLSPPTMTDEQPEPPQQPEKPEPPTN